MFGLFGKKENLEIYSPISGKIIALEDVPDNVFASKMMGDGVAFEPEEGLVCAPCDGTIEMIFPTLHAFAMKLNNGAELLVHIGLDTVSLEGQGFKKLVDPEIKVKKGTPVIEINLEFMRKNGVILTTPMVITNSSDFKLEFEKHDSVIRGRDIVLRCNK